MKQEWIIGLGGSELDDVIVYKFTGTTEDAKQKLIDLINKERENHDPDDWEFGCDSVEDVATCSGGKLYAYGCWRNFHTDYTATPLDIVESI